MIVAIECIFSVLYIHQARGFFGGFLLRKRLQNHMALNPTPKICVWEQLKMLS